LIMVLKWPGCCMEPVTSMHSLEHSLVSIIALIEH
jgi:hypothetical protein